MNNPEYQERLESLEKENEKLQERINQLEYQLGETETKETDQASLNLSRRGTIAALAGAGGLWAATGTASATVDNANDLLGDEMKGTPGNGNHGFRIWKEDNGRALWVIGNGDNSRVFQASATSASSRAIEGYNNAAGGDAIRGFVANSSGKSRGLVGRTQSPDGKGLEGRIAASSSPSDSGWGIAVDALNLQDDGTGLRATASGDGSPTGVLAQVNTSNGLSIKAKGDALFEDNVDVENDLTVTGKIKTSSGNLKVAGTKHFVQAVETPEGSKEVVYTSVEAGKPRTEVSDVTELTDGQAEITLPEHFSLITSEEESLSIQITPYAESHVSPQVVEHSTEKLVIEDLSDSDCDYTFAYTVKGVRKGHEDKEAIRDKQSIDTTI